MALTVAYSGAGTLIITAVVRKTLGLRATRDAELSGLDSPEHAETAYDHGRFGLTHTATPTPTFMPPRLCPRPAPAPAGGETPG